MPTVDVELHAGESAAKPSSFVDRDATRNSRARIGEKSLQKDAGETCAESTSLDIACPHVDSFRLVVRSEDGAARLEPEPRRPRYKYRSALVFSHSRLKYRLYFAR
jgi:hypothetical protein